MERKETLPPRQPLTELELPSENNVASDIEESASNWLDFIFGSKEQREKDMDFLKSLNEKK